MWPIFTKTLYDSRKMTFWLFVGYLLYGLMIGGLYPSIIDAAEGYNEMVESMPEILSFMGVDAETFDLANLGTYVHIEMMAWLMLIAGAVAIYHAFSAFTNPERNQSIEMLLSLPLSRRENLIGQFLVTVLMMIVALFGGYIGLIVTTAFWEDIEYSAVDLAIGVMGAILPLLVITTFSYLLTAVVPSSKRYAGAIAYVLWIGSYLVYGFTLSIDWLNDLQPFFVYHYYNAGDLINEGINAGYWLLLLVVAGLLLATAWWRIDDKELGV